MLTQVILPKFCLTIGRFAFEDCKQLVEIDIPDTVRIIGPAAFRACPLRSLKIPKNVTEIECCLCQDCSSLERVDFPETLTAIGAAPFFEAAADFLVPPKYVPFEYLHFGSLIYLLAICYNMFGI